MSESGTGAPESGPRDARSGDAESGDTGSAAAGSDDAGPADTGADGAAPALVVEDVTRRYGDLTALDGVSLTVAEGEVLALLGPNGAGKTTLVRAATGTVAVEGRVRLFGRPPREVDPARLGVLPQAFSPPDRLTARETVAHYAGLYEEARDPGAVLATVGVADAADTQYRNLSGGQQRRTTLATALVADPDLLVLDEPTTGVDPAGRRRVREIVAGLADGGTTVLFTTHEIPEAERLADRVAMLAGGELVAHGRPAELVRERGGDPRLVVGVDPPVGDGRPERAADPGIEVLDPETLDVPGTARAVDGDLVVEGIDPADVGRAVEAVRAAGRTVADLRWSRPGLEDVYLDRTGRGPDRPARLDSIADLGDGDGGVDADRGVGDGTGRSVGDGTGRGGGTGAGSGTTGATAPDGDGGADGGDRR